MSIAKTNQALLATESGANVMRLGNSKRDEPIKKENKVTAKLAGKLLSLSSSHPAGHQLENKLSFKL